MQCESQCNLPVVVVVGFAGSRHLAMDGEGKAVPLSECAEAQLQQVLTDAIAGLGQELKLESEHFLCGVSQLAVGGDLIFTQALQGSGISQRIFLPGPREGYLHGRGSAGPDFSAEERAHARGLLDSPHIIEERVVSESSDRGVGFEEVNLEILRVSDVVICLVRKGAADSAGGTLDLFARACRQGTPALKIEVHVDGDQVHHESSWHQREFFVTPALPAVLAGAHLPPTQSGRPRPSAGDFADAITRHAGSQATMLRDYFNTVALIILGTHILATLLALVAILLGSASLKAYINSGKYWVVGALLVESALLLGGFFAHRRLHGTHAARNWARARLVAEIGRSVRAAGELKIYLGYLFDVVLPVGMEVKSAIAPRPQSEFRALLRTLVVLQLCAPREDKDHWRTCQTAYIDHRISGPDGQMSYYRNAAEKAGRQLRWAHSVFVLASGMAMVFTGTKVFLKLGFMSPPILDVQPLGDILGALAVFFPVVAVAALSFAAALDLEARAQTYRDMVNFLERQDSRLRVATTRAEFTRLVTESEARLLGETAIWYDRRAFTGVA